MKRQIDLQYNRCRIVIVTFLFSSLTTIVQAQTSRVSAGIEDEQYTIKENVDYVVLHPTVQDRHGSFVAGLSKDDFQIYENGVLQQIKHFSHEDIPVTVGLVVDNSGSMSKKRPEVVAAALSFARSSKPADQLFAVTFNERVVFGLPAEVPFTDNVSHLEIALSRIASNGMSALYDAIAASLNHLIKGDGDKKVLIVVSDGADNASKLTLAQVMVMANQSDAIIYTIGVFEPTDPDRNPRALRKLAQETGGRAFFPRRLDAVLSVSQQIAQDIRNQYTIAYSPANPGQGKSYRSIKVTARSSTWGKLTVRTRAGYYSSTPSSGLSKQP